MNSFQCDDCQHSFYVPGTNLPLVIQGGCPECGGTARPEPDQPSPTRPDGDGRVRNLVDPDTGDDTGGNPLQEGILADGGWQNRRVRDESFASVRQADQGLIPCPHCGGNIQHKQSACVGCGGSGQAGEQYSGASACPVCQGGGAGDQWWQCQGCGKKWDDNDAAMQELHPGNINPPSCPTCGKRTYRRDDLNRFLYPNGAYECENDWPHTHAAEDIVPDAPPEDWGKASSNDPPRDEYVTPMRTHPEASNQTPSLPWQFEVEEVAEPGMDNEKAEDKINGQDKKAGEIGESAGGAAGGMAGGAIGAGLGSLIGPEGTLLGGMAGKFLGGAAGRLMGGALGGGGGNASTPPQGPVEARPLDMLSATSLPGGGTPDEFPKDTEDPEKVDPKEHNDGDHKEWQNDVSVNGMGGTDSPHGFDPAGAGIERLQMLLPLVLHYFHSDESGADDPVIKALHETLEGENPGYLDQESDPQHLEIVLKMHKPNGQDDSSSLPQAEDVEGADQSDDGKDKEEGHRTHEGAYSQLSGDCPGCLGTGVGHGGSCPNCNGTGRAEEISDHAMREWFPNAMAQQDIRNLPETEHPLGPTTGASHQGPHSPEQIAAVQQLLMDQGRTEEVPNVPMAPWEYADELAQVAHKPDQPPQDTGAQPQPMQDPAPPEDTMPMPGMEAPPPGQFGQPTGSRQANPEYINVEPNWEGMRAWLLNMARSDIDNALKINREMGGEGLPEEQLLSAHGDQHIQKAPMEWDDPRNSAHDHTDALQGVPAADQLGQEDIEQDSDSSNAWQTSDGQPLVVGEQYELQTPGVDIPDIVRVKAVRPESVTLEFTGAYELGFSKDITRQEFNTMGYQFQHVRGDEPEAQASEDANNAPDNGNIPDFSGPGSGASDSQHQVMTKWKVTSDTRESFMPGSPGGTQPGGQCPQCGGPLQPDGSCAGCERSNIAPGAPGVPPAPAGVQNPNGGPPSTPAPMPMNPGGSNPSRPPQSRPPTAYSSMPTHDPETGQLLDDEAQRTIARLMRNAASEASGEHQVPAAEADLVMAGADARDWLSDFGDKTAGAQFSPSEQRALIDEEGTARNADKLDLSHTHYEARRHTTADDFMFGL